MAQMERDMGTKLEWAAADHYDTGRPHTHIIIRGKRDNGKDLVIPKAYISKGMRDVAEHLATFDVAKTLAIQTTQERFTSLDRDLLSSSVKNIVDLSSVPKAGAEWSQRFNLWRVKHLAKMGLAEKVGMGRWRLDDKLEATLRRMGDRSDILKAYHKSLKAARIERPSFNDPVYDPLDNLAKPVTGRVIKTGILDDVNDRSFMVPVFVETGSEANITEIEPGMIVKAGPQSFQPKTSDYTIADIASKRGGVYSPSAHEMSDPSASEGYVQAHVRRLEAMRRAGHAVRNQDGSFNIPKDYLSKASLYEHNKGRSNPAKLEILSRTRLSDLKKQMGKTWLDNELMSKASHQPLSGFGAELEEAKAGRRQYLMANKLLSKSGGVTRGTLNALEKIDLDDAAKGLSRELKKPYKTAPKTGRVSGTYTGMIDRASGRYAIIEKSKEFTLVPWRKTMDRNPLTKGMGRNLS